MNSQMMQKSALPFGIDLDDEVTVKLWSDGSITCIKYGGIGEQDEVPISKNGVVKLITWLNKHAASCENCGQPRRNHSGRGKVFCENRPTAYKRAQEAE